MTGLIPSEIQLPMNLRFPADTLVVKSIAYHSNTAPADVDDVIQIWCNITNDSLIAAFTNINTISHSYDQYFTISNTFQSGNFILQFQGTDTSLYDTNVPAPVFDPNVRASYNPHRHRIHKEHLE